MIGVGAVLLGTVLLPHKPARITTGLLAAAVGVTFIPGFTHLSFDVIGLGPTLWRMSWLLTMAALVGVAVAWLTDRLPWQRLAFVGPTALAGALLVAGDPIWAGPRRPSSRHRSISSATRTRSRSPTGSSLRLRPVTSSSPRGSSRSRSTSDDSRIHAVVPRAYFMEYLQDEPGFHYDARLALHEFANGGDWQRDRVVRDLHKVGVDTICLPTPRPSGAKRDPRGGFRAGLRRVRLSLLLEEIALPMGATTCCQRCPTVRV